MHKHVKVNGILVDKPLGVLVDKPRIFFFFQIKTHA